MVIYRAENQPVMCDRIRWIFWYNFALVLSRQKILFASLIKVSRKLLSVKISCTGCGRAVDRGRYDELLCSNDGGGRRGGGGGAGRAERDNDGGRGGNRDYTWWYRDHREEMFCCCCLETMLFMTRQSRCHMWPMYLCVSTTAAAVSSRLPAYHQHYTFYDINPPPPSSKYVCHNDSFCKMLHGPTFYYYPRYGGVTKHPRRRNFNNDFIMQSFYWCNNCIYFTLNLMHFYKTSFF